MIRFTLLLFLSLSFYQLQAQHLDIGFKAGLSGNRSKFHKGDIHQSPYSKEHDGATGLGYGFYGGPDFWYHFNEQFGIKSGVYFRFTDSWVDNEKNEQDTNYVYGIWIQHLAIEIPLQASYNIRKKLSIHGGLSLKVKLRNLFDVDYLSIHKNSHYNNGDYTSTSAWGYIKYEDVPKDQGDYNYSGQTSLNNHINNFGVGYDYEGETQYFYQKRLELNFVLGVSYQIKKLVIGLETAFMLNNPMPEYENYSKDNYELDKLRSTFLDLSFCYYFNGKF